MFTMNNKKQPPEVFYKKAVLKTFLNANRKISVFESLPNQVAALQISNFFKKRFQRRCFLVNIAKFLKKLILKKICEPLLLKNVKQNYSFMKIVKQVLNVSQHSQESNFTGVSFLINIVVAFNLNLSFFKKRSRYWCFPDSYLKFLTKTFSKREKKHCYKNRSIVIRNVDQRSQIYLRSFFCNFAKISVFQQGVSRVYSDNRLFYQSKKITESSKSLTIEFWQSLTCQNLTGQT